MANKSIVIFGAGGLGREILWQLEEVNKRTKEYNILGFVDDGADLQGKEVNGFPVLGDRLWLQNYPEEICVLICIGSAKVRKTVYENIKNNNCLSFPNFIAEGVRLSKFVKFGQGCIVCLSATMTVNISFGDFVIVNPDCTIGHDAVIEDFVTLYPSVNVSGAVRIGECCEIGVGANIIQGKSIGENAIIGAGAVVIRDMPPDCTAVGVPAVPLEK